MKLNIIKAGTAAALLVGSGLVYAHAITPVDTDVEAGSTAYVGAGSLVVKTGDGECLRTSDFSEDSQVNVCEGIEDEPVAETETTETVEPPKPEPTIVPIARSIKAQFETDSDVPTADGESAIAALITELTSLQEIVSIDVAGHTDSTGSDAYNQDLSERRAATVRSRLESAFPDANITSTGYGESQPIANNNTAEGRAINRRVDVNVNARTAVNN